MLTKIFNEDDKRTNTLIMYKNIFTLLLFFISHLVISIGDNGKNYINEKD